jgi:hypothetical protein
MIESVDIHSDTGDYVLARHNYVHAVVNKVNQTQENVNEPLLDGSTAVYIAAEGGYADEIKTLAEMGADVNTPNHNGWTPVIIATCNDQIKVIKILAKFGANLDSRDNNGDAAVTIAAWNGCVATLYVLAKLGADMDLPDEDGSTPLFTAHVADQVDTCVALMTLGADVSQYMSWSLHSGVAPARKLFYDFFDMCDVPMRSDMCPLFSLTKLMTMMMKTDDDDTSMTLATLCDDAHEETVNLCGNQNLSEMHIANALYHSIITTEKRQQMQQNRYPLKSKLCQVAWRVYIASLTLDGDRITPTTKALRYVELLSLLLDKAMLTDTFALRVTCKANNEIRRFPVCYGVYRELEANLIEGFVAIEASRFVATQDIQLAIQLHSCTAGN